MFQSFAADVLSQKMTQLSIKKTNEHSFEMKDFKDDIMVIPEYLSKRNKSFRDMINSVISIAGFIKSDSIVEDLRQIAIIIYKRMFIRINQNLWITYFKSGIGQLILSSKQSFNYPINVHVWPKEVKNLVDGSRDTKDRQKNDVYKNYVDKYLHKLETQLEHYDTELNNRMNCFQNYALKLQHSIETYIEQHINSLRMDIDHKIELVHYDYHIQALKLEYYNHHPNEYQVCFYLK